MYNLIKSLYTIGFLTKTIVGGEEIFHIMTPCRFEFEEDIVVSLKDSYRSDNAITGILWAKPTMIADRNTYAVNRISFIDLNIAESRQTGHQGVTIPSPADSRKFDEEIHKAVNHGYLPLRFHFDCVRDSDFYQTFSKPDLFSETVCHESSFSYIFDKQKFLMPHCVIFGSDIHNKEIFIGIYNGFISQMSVTDCKKKLEAVKLNSLPSFLSGNTNGLALGAAMLLFLILQNPRFSLPVILELARFIPEFAAGSGNSVTPDFFNILSSGSVEIIIPGV